MDRKYKAFISYSHANNREAGRKWVDWLHQQLETYEVPEELVGQTNEAGEVIPHSIFPVFQDEKELSASASLSHALNAALEQSEYLIFLASPKSAQSMYVREELRCFKQLGRKDKMIALIIDGEPEYGAEQSTNQCFPDELRYGIAADGSIDYNQHQEVLAADVRLPNTQNQGYTSLEAYKQALQQAGASKAEVQQKTELYKERLELAKLKIIAGVLGVPLGELTKRDKAFQLEKAQRKNRIIKRVATAIAMLALAVAVAGVMAWMQKNEAQKNLSLSLYNFGINKLTESEYGDGAAFIAAATRGGDPGAALFGQSMLAMQDNLTRLPNAQLSTMRFSPDGKWLLGFANSGLGEFKLQLWDAISKKRRQQFEDFVSKEPSAAVFDEQGQAYLQRDDHSVVRLNLASASLTPVWHAPAGVNTYLRAVSADGQWLFVTVRDPNQPKQRSFRVVRLADGVSHDISTGIANDMVDMMAFAPTSKALWVALWNEGQQQIRVIQLGDSLTTVLDVREADSSRQISWHPNGQQLLLNNDKHISVYDIRNGRHWQHDKPASGLQFVNFNPQDKTVLLGSYQQLQVLDGATGRTVKQIDAPYLTGFGLMTQVLNAPQQENNDLSPDMSQQLVNLNKQPFLRTLWSLPLLKSEQILSDKLHRLRPAGDGEHVYLHFQDQNNIQKNSLDLHRAQPDFIRLDEPIADIKVLAKAGQVVVRGVSNKLYVFDEASGAPVGQVITLAPQAKNFQINAEETQILAKTGDNSLGIWSLATGKQIANWPAPQPIVRYIVDADFNHVVLADDQGYAIYGLQDAKLVQQGQGQLSGAKFSPNGKYLEITRHSGDVDVLDGRRFEPVLTVKSIANPFVVFNHQGTVMAISEDANYMRLWDLARKKPFGQRIKVSQKASVFAFSADDTRIIVQSDGAQVNQFETKIIDATTGMPMTMPFAKASYIESFVLNEQNLLTVENKLSGYVYQVWEIPGLLQVAPDKIADDLEKYYGKVLNAQTGAIDNAPPSRRDYATWYFQDAYTRSLTPNAKTSVVDVIRRYSEFKSPGDVYMLSETFAYHPLARAALAKHFSERAETGFIAARYVAITEPQLARITDGQLKAEVNALLTAARQSLQGN